MLPKNKYFLLNLYHILNDGFFDAIPVLLTFVVLAYGLGEKEIGIVISSGTALSTVAGLATIYFSNHLSPLKILSLVIAMGGAGFLAAAFSPNFIFTGLSFTIIMFGLLGLIPVQYCYFEAIKYGDASIATILQFIGPFFILFYLTIVKRQAPRRIEVICTIIAFIGVFILATHGNINHLAITPQVLFWGLLSAIGVATNTLIPKSLIHEFSPTAVTGWGLLIAGVGLFIIHPHVSASILAPQAIVPLLCVLVIGTIIPFQLFTSALRYVKATTASMLDAFEPISATIGSILVFNMHFYLADMIGSVLIILAVILLNWQPKGKIQ